MADSNTHQKPLLDAAAFLDLFPGEHIFCATRGEKDGNIKWADGITRGQVKTLNARGAGVFFAVNAFRGTHRRETDIIRVRAVYAEDDNPRETWRTDWPVPPSVVVRSSVSDAGWKYHYYWLLDGEDATEAVKQQVKALLRRIAEVYDTDTAATDLARVLRLPGSLHWKTGKGVPVVVVSVEGDDDVRRYALADLVRAFGLGEQHTAKVVPLHAGDGGLDVPTLGQAVRGDLERLTGLLGVINPDLPYKQWWAVLRCAGRHFHGTPDEDAAWKALEDWSKKGAKWNAEKFASKRADIANTTEGGFGSIITAARDGLDSGWLDTLDDAQERRAAAEGVLEARRQIDPSLFEAAEEEPKGEGPSSDAFASLSRYYPQWDPALFPPVLSDIATAVFAAEGTDPCAVITATVAAASACVDKRVLVAPKPTTSPQWMVPATLFMGICAPPSNRKSPANDTAFNHLRERNKELSEEGVKNRDAYQFALDAYKDAVNKMKKEHGKAVLEATQGGLPAPLMPTLPQKPKPFVHRRLLVDRATTEGLEKALVNSPQGSFLFSDELGEFFQSIGLYKENSPDVQRWIGFYDGKDTTVLRSQEENCRTFESGAGIYGGIQPAVLHRALKAHTGTGLIERFLLVSMRTPKPPEDPTPMPREAVMRYELMLDNIIDNRDAKGTDIGISGRQFSPEAEAFMHTVDQRVNGLGRVGDEGTSLDGTLMGTLKKATGTLAKLALVFHEVLIASDEDYTHRHTVPLSTVKMAWEAYAVFFLPHLRVIHDAELHDLVTKVARKILIKGWTEVKASMLIAEFRFVRNLERQQERIAMCLNLMTALGELGWCLQDDKAPWDNPMWKVNKRVHTLFAKEAQTFALSEAMLTADLSDKLNSLGGQ